MPNTQPYVAPGISPTAANDLAAKRQQALDAIDAQLGASTNDINAQFINDTSNQQLLRNNLGKSADLAAAGSNQDWLANYTTTAKNQREKALKDSATNRLASLQAALRQSKDKLSNDAASRGLANTGIYATADKSLNADYLNKEQQINGDLQNNIATIEDSYTKSLYDINQQTQAKQAALQDKYQANAQKIADAMGMKAKDKASMLVKLRDQLVQSKKDINSQYDKLTETALNDAQKNFKNELDVSSLTGNYRGDPTLAAQKSADDKAYKDAMFKLNQLKVEIAAQKKKSGGSKSSSSSSGDSVSSLLDTYKQKTASGIDPKVAETQTLAQAVGTKLKASLRSAIESGPAQYQQAEGPVRPGESGVYATTGKTWADFVNPKSSNSGLSPEQKARLAKYGY